MADLYEKGIRFKSRFDKRDNYNYEITDHIYEQVQRVVAGKKKTKLQFARYKILNRDLADLSISFLSKESISKMKYFHQSKEEFEKGVRSGLWIIQSDG